MSCCSKIKISLVLHAAAGFFNEAAEEAEAAMKPKLSMKYFELAAEAEGMM